MRRRHNAVNSARPHSLEPQSPAKAIKRASTSLPPIGATARLIERDCTRMAEQMFDSRILLLFEMFRRRSPGPCNIFNTFSFDVKRRCSAPPRLLRDSTGKMVLKMQRQESCEHNDDSLTVVFVFHALAMLICAVGVVVALMNTAASKSVLGDLLGAFFDR